MSRFDEWWDWYPKKQGRKACKTKWVLRKLDDQADEIIAHTIQRCKDDKKWQAGFIPMPATFLNQDRWLDEYEKTHIHSEPQEVPAALRHWLNLCDSDAAWCVRMAHWKHQPAEGPLRRGIDQYLALPAAEQRRLAIKYGQALPQ